MVQLVPFGTVGRVKNVQLRKIGVKHVSAPYSVNQYWDYQLKKIRRRKRTDRRVIDLGVVKYQTEER